MVAAGMSLAAGCARTARLPDVYRTSAGLRCHDRMFTSSAFTIRPAVAADEDPLRRLAALDSRPPLKGPAIVAEMEGGIVAAISVDSGRSIADPFVLTAELSDALRATRTRHLRRGSMPTLSERIVASLRRVAPAV